MKLFSTCQRLWHDDEGQDIIEYALLAVFISIIAVTTIQTIGSNVNTLYGDVSSAMP